MREIQLRSTQVRWLLKIQEKAAAALASYPAPFGLLIASTVTAYAGYRLERLKQLRIKRALARS